MGFTSNYLLWLQNPMVVAVKGCFLEEGVDSFQKIEGKQLELQLKFQPKLCIKRGPQINFWIDFQLKFFQVFCCSNIVWYIGDLWPLEELCFPTFSIGTPRFMLVIIYSSGIKNAKRMHIFSFLVVQSKEIWSSWVYWIFL